MRLIQETKKIRELPVTWKWILRIPIRCHLVLGPRSYPDPIKVWLPADNPERMLILCKRLHYVEFDCCHDSNTGPYWEYVRTTVVSPSFKVDTSCVIAQLPLAAVNVKSHRGLTRQAKLWIKQTSPHIYPKLVLIKSNVHACDPRAEILSGARSQSPSEEAFSIGTLLVTLEVRPATPSQQGFARLDWWIVLLYCILLQSNGLETHTGNLWFGCVWSVPRCGMHYITTG